MVSEYHWKTMEQKSSDKLIITKTSWMQEQPQLIFCGLYGEKGFYQVNFSRAISSSSRNDHQIEVGDIIVGRVRDLVKNLNAAFIEILPGYTGYFQMDENPAPIFLNKKNTEKLCQGDLVLIQVKKAAIQSKAPVLTSKISLAGKYLVLIGNDHGVSLSGKIQSHERRQELKVMFQEDTEKNQVGIILRTNSEFADNRMIQEEYQRLCAKWEKLQNQALHLTCYSVLAPSEAEYIKQINSLSEQKSVTIVTDLPEQYQELRQYIQQSGAEHLSIEYYEDTLLPLYKCYGIETAIQKLLSRQVWLKSGAYLIIEPTEAMVVIDVNSGKCQRGKHHEETALQINLEAAKEIALQLRLRNLSGIIIIDFINMEKESHKLQLIDTLQSSIRQDVVKTTFVEITKLDLVILTRKKIEAPVYRQLLENKSR